MADQNKHIDDLSRDELNQYKETAPDDVWGLLEKKLIEHKAAKRRSYKKWWYLPLALLFIGASVFIGKNMLHTNHGKTSNGFNVPTFSGEKNNTVQDNITNQKTGEQKNSDKRAPEKKETKSIHAKKAIRNKAQGYSHKSVKHVREKNAKYALKRPMRNNTIAKRTTKAIVNNKPTNYASNSGKQPSTTGRSKPNDNKPKGTSKPKNYIDTNKKAVKETKTIVPNLLKTDTTTMNDTSTQNKVKKQKPSLELGIKAGYGIGFQTFTANKITGAAFIRLKVSRKVSIGLQPGFAYSTLNKTPFSGNSPGGQHSYYNITHNQVDSVTEPGVFFTNYYYKQTYDSIVVSHTVAKSYFEIQLPILLKYNVTKNFSISGGPCINLGKIVGISEQKTVYHLTVEDSILYSRVPLPPSFINSVFVHTGVPYSSASFDTYQNPSSMVFRFGYNIGLEYIIKDRVSLGVSMQQNINWLTSIPNPDVRGLYEQPYFYISIGYKIYTLKHKNPK